MHELEDSKLLRCRLSTERSVDLSVSSPDTEPTIYMLYYRYSLEH